MRRNAAEMQRGCVRPSVRLGGFSLDCAHGLSALLSLRDSFAIGIDLEQQPARVRCELLDD